MRATHSKCHSTILGLVFVLLLPTWVGCQSSRNQREVALLRAEILDLEDQYYALKSRCEVAEGQLGAYDEGYSGDPMYVDNVGPSGEVIIDEYSSPEIVDPGYRRGSMMGEIVGSGRCYEDQSIVNNGIIYEGSQIYEGSPIYEEGPIIHHAPNQSRYYREPSAPAQRQTGFGTNVRRKPQWLENVQSFFGRRPNGASSTTRYSGSQLQTAAATPTPFLSRLRDRLPFGGNDTSVADSRPNRTGNFGTRRFGFDRPDPGTDSTPDIDIVVPELDTQNLDNSIALETPEMDTQDAFETDPLDIDIDLNEPQFDVELNQNSVSEVFISRDITQGQNIDGKPGDDGLVVLVQPKSEFGEIVMQPAEMTVSLIDPLADSQQQRIGLWEFTANEMALFATDQTDSQKGYLLHLPWDQNIPRHKNLMLFVRYQTSDGRKIESRRELLISPPGSGQSADPELITGWTKRDPRWNYQSLPNAVAGERVQPTTPVRGGAVRATPASSTIKRPQWRPSR